MVNINFSRTEVFDTYFSLESKLCSLGNSSRFSRYEP